MKNPKIKKIRRKLDKLDDKMLTIIKKRSIAFIVSDFIYNEYEQDLKIANKKHDIVALKVFDPREKILPNMGYVLFEDAETGTKQWVNTNNKMHHLKYKNNALSREHLTTEIFKKSNVDFANINIEQGYIKPLMNLFKRR